MKKKLLMGMMLTVAVIMLAACGKEGESTGQDTVDVTITDESNSMSDDEISYQEGTIQAEIADVEKQAAEIFDNLGNDATQTDMNICAADEYAIWDNELNSLWSRLSDELSAERKAEILEEQREWITRKDREIKAAGKEAEGGSMQPMLECSEGAYLTRARVYILASYLAEVRGENFVIPEDAKAVGIDDMSVEAMTPTFERLEGQHTIIHEEDDISTWGDGRYGVIAVQRFEDSDFVKDGFVGDPTWVVSVTHGDVFTDLDVVEFTNESITFKNGAGYAQLRLNIAYEVELGYGSTLDNLDEDVIYTIKD